MKFLKFFEYTMLLSAEGKKAATFSNSFQIQLHDMIDRLVSAGYREHQIQNEASKPFNPFIF